MPASSSCDFLQVLGRDFAGLIYNHCDLFGMGQLMCTARCFSYGDAATALRHHDHIDTALSRLQQTSGIYLRFDGSAKSCGKAAAVISDDGKLLTWGVNNAYDRLGCGVFGRTSADPGLPRPCDGLGTTPVVVVPGITENSCLVSVLSDEQEARVKLLSTCSGVDTTGRTLHRASALDTIVLRGPVKRVAFGQNYAWVVTFNGKACRMGENDEGQLGFPVTDKCLGRHVVHPWRSLEDVKSLWGRVLDVAVGVSFTILLTYDGEVFTCGRNSHGQLGNDQSGERHRWELRAVGAFAGARVLRISAGRVHGAAVVAMGNDGGIDDDGSQGHSRCCVFTWGSYSFNCETEPGPVWQSDQGPFYLRTESCPIKVPNTLGAQDVKSCGDTNVVLYKDGRVCAWTTVKRWVGGITRCSCGFLGGGGYAGNTKNNEWGGVELVGDESCFLIQKETRILCHCVPLCSIKESPKIAKVTRNVNGVCFNADYDDEDDWESDEGNPEDTDAKEEKKDDEDEDTAVRIKEYPAWPRPLPANRNAGALPRAL